MNLTVNLSMDPASHILYEGVLADIPIGRLATTQSKVFELPVSFVSCGRFEISVDAFHFESSRKKSRQARGQLRAAVRQ